MVNKALCRKCIYRTYLAWVDSCCGYLLYTGKRRVPQMDPERPDECPVMVEGEPVSTEIGKNLFRQESRSYTDKQRAGHKEG